MWSLGLRDFDDVIPPREAPYLLNPAFELDYARFCSDQLLDCYLDLAGIIRAAAPEALVTTNFMGFFPLVDYGAWSEHVDVLADDHYTDPANPGTRLTASLAHSYLRTLGGGEPWVLMEQAAGAVNWREHNVPGRRSRRTGSTPGVPTRTGPMSSPTSSSARRRADPRSSTRRWCHMPEPGRRGSGP